MSTTTSNYGIRKPEASDTVNVELDIAQPYDEIDEILAAKADTGHTHADMATDAEVAAAVAALVDSSPAALNTLNELAAAIGDDANFATTMTTALAEKITAAQHAVIDHTGIPGVGAGGGTGTGFEETSPDVWSFVPDDGSVAIAGLGADNDGSVGLQGGASIDLLTTGDDSDINITASGAASDVNISGSGTVHVSGAGGDAFVTLSSTHAELTATNDVGIEAVNGDLTFADGIGPITLDALRTVQTNHISKGLVDAKGDIIAATAADTVARLGVGTDGQVLTAASGQATGLQWATPSSGISGQGAGTNSVLVGDSAAASADQSTALGDFAVASSDGAIAIGSGTNATSAAQATTGQGAIAIGASDGSGVAGARASGANSVAIGSGDGTNAGASATTSQSIAIGHRANIATATNAIVIGTAANVTGGSHNHALALGTWAAGSSTNVIAIGGGADSTRAASASATGGIAIGASDTSAVAGARCSGAQSIAIGGGTSGAAGASASGAQAVAIGRLAVASHATAVALGAGAATTAANQIMLGTASERVVVPGILDAPVTANRQTGSYTLVLADASKIVEMNVGSANDLTVPPNSSVAFPVGTVIELFQYGAGQTTVVQGSGVTIRSSGGKLKLTGQYSAASLRKIATDEWQLTGDIAS